jgi:hypothetical protein
VRSRLVPFRVRLGPTSAAPSLLWRIDRQPLGSLGMPSSEDRWRPAGRLFIDGAVQAAHFHPYKGERSPLSVASSGEEEIGEPGPGGSTPTCAADGVRSGERFREIYNHVRPTRSARLPHVACRPPHRAQPISARRCPKLDSGHPRRSSRASMSAWNGEFASVRLSTDRRC